MESLVIHETFKTPAIIFMTDGNLIIKGKSIPENVYRIYSPAISWIEKFNAEDITLQIDLEYINSASKMMLMEVFRTIESNKNIKSIVVNWYYDAEDEDHFEMGKIFEECTTRTSFDYIACQASDGY
jgi:hypothetical protein